MGLKLRLKNRAFSLLEVVITVGILATGIIIIMQAMMLSGRAAGVSCDIVKASFLARDKIQEFEYNETVGKFSSGTSGSVNNDEFKWNSAINKITTDNPSGQTVNLYQLNLNITWQRGSSNQDLGLSTYLRKNG